MDCQKTSRQHADGKGFTMQRFCLLSLLTMTFTAPIVFAQDATAPKYKSTTPVIQTAKWAQRWWMPRHKQKVERVKRGECDLLMLGDSITHSWENGGRKVWQEFYAKRKAVNIGFSGDRTEHVLWRLQNGGVDGISPKLIVIMIGTNNTGHRMDPAEETATGVQEIIKQLRKRIPEAKILLLAIFPRGEKPDHKMRKRNDEINAKIAKFADKKTVHYLDINNMFLDDDGNLPKSIMPDRLHPNAGGYQKWAEAMEPSIKKLLGE
jgi:lysophospholipase L1-like esterase